VVIKSESARMGEEYSIQSVVRKLEEISEGTPSTLEDNIKVEQINTERFIMFSVITNIYNKKTKGPNLMELFTATGKLKTFYLLVFFLTTRDVVATT
jgi:hypothetical protein